MVRIHAGQGRSRKASGVGKKTPSSAGLCSHLARPVMWNEKLGSGVEIPSSCLVRDGIRELPSSSNVGRPRDADTALDLHAIQRGAVAGVPVCELRAVEICNLRCTGDRGIAWCSSIIPSDDCFNNTNHRDQSNSRFDHIYGLKTCQ